MSEKNLVNTLYHGAVIGVLATSYDRLFSMVSKKPPSKLDFQMRDLGMVALDMSLAVWTRDMLVKQGILPPDIIKSA